jgi:hypothetical protein
VEERGQNFQMTLKIIQNVPQVWGHKRTQLFGRKWKKVKWEQLLQMMCLKSQVLGLFFVYDEPLWRYALFIINNGKLRRCCHVDMAAKGECASRVGGSGSEKDTGGTGNA